MEEATEVIEIPEPTETEVSESAEEVAESAPAEEVAPAEEPVKKENRVQERIDKITREKHEARQEAEYWRKVATGEIKPPAPAAPATPPADFIPPGYKPEPQLDQFDDWDQYNRALVRWEAGKIIAERDYLAEQGKAKQAKQTVVEKHLQRVESVKDKYADYDEVIALSDTQFINSTFDAIAESEQSADISYFLASNPKEADRINSLNPVQQIKEIARLEVKFSAPDATPAKRITQAPAPIKAIGGSDAGVVEPNKMTDEQWLAHERKRLAAQGRRY